MQMIFEQTKLIDTAARYIHTTADLLLVNNNVDAENWIQNKTWALIDERKKAKMKQNQTVSDNLTGTFRKRYNDNDLNTNVRIAVNASKTVN